MSSRCVVSTTKITSASVQTNLNSMFCWPCISTHLCDKNQFDALFILILFRPSTFTCLGHICSPSSGSILHIYNTYELYIHSIPPDDVLQIWPRHVEVEWRNELRTNSASSWFLLHKSKFCFFIEVHVSPNLRSSSVSQLVFKTYS